MRTYENCIEEFLEYYYEKTKQEYYNPENLQNMSEREIGIFKGRVWRKLLSLCYKKIDGIYWFMRFVLGDLTYAGYPEPISFNSLWYDWAKLMSKGSHISILCPRQHGKTTFWSVIQTVYRASLFENYNILIESASSEQAESILGFTTNIIENNEFLVSKKAKNTKWSTTDLKYNGGVVRARGVGSEVRGGTYDYIVCDDILRSDNKLSDDDIEHFIDEELEPMLLVRKGQMVIVGTPKSYTDIFTTIEKRTAFTVGSKGWQMFKYQAILNEEKQTILCPDRFTYDQLMERKKIMGQQKFDKEFMCECYSSGTALFQRELIDLATERGIVFDLSPVLKPEEDNDWQYYMGVDVARAGTASADFTVATVIGYNERTQDKKLCWYWKEKGLKISEQTNHIAEIAKNYNYPIILVEKNNMGQDMIDDLADNHNLSVEAFTTTNKSKEDLIRFLIVQFETEKLILPIRNERSREMIKDLKNELLKFVVEITRAGNEVMKGSGNSHDDMVMSLALAMKNTQGRFLPFALKGSERKTELEQFLETNDDKYWMTL